jgi:hypothetical protein
VQQKTIETGSTNAQTPDNYARAFGIRRWRQERPMQDRAIGLCYRGRGRRDRARNHNGGLIMHDNFYACLGLGLIVGWLLSGVSTFLILAILSGATRK